MFHQVITQAIEDFANAFAARPFDYLYEPDVQADLHGRLRRMLEANPVDLGDVRDLQRHPMSERRVSRVHAEYPKQKCFDLALIGASDGNASVWNQPIAAAFEIKFWQADGTGGGIDKDLQKLHAQATQCGAGPFLGVSLIARHPGKDAATEGALDARTPPLEPVSGPSENGVFVCAVNAERGEKQVRWWRSTTSPA